MKDSITKTSKILIFLFPILLTAILFYIRQTDYGRYEPWGLEDGIFEYIQVISLCIASIILAIGSYLLIKKKNYLTSIIISIISIGLFVVAMEEISWGQRLFNLETNGIFAEKNVQNEINIHNLSPFYDVIRYVYITIGLVGTFGWIFKFVHTQNILLKFVQQFIHPWYVAPYFVMLLINLMDTHFAAPQDLEYTELLLSFGFLVYSVYMVKYFELNKPVEFHKN